MNNFGKSSTSDTIKLRVIKPIITIDKYRSYESINNHSVRIYECDNNTYYLDKNNSAIPAYYKLLTDNKSGMPTKIDINFQDGLSWAKAEKIVFDYINKVCNTDNT